MRKLQGTVGLFVLLALGIQPLAIAAEVMPTDASNAPLKVAQQTAAVAVIYVSPNGTDAAGAGSQTAPFRTITAALNSNPQPGTTIKLAQGTYSAETGEVFPLKLLPGVKIQGNNSTKGEDILIKGGGVFISPTFARQNIAMLAAKNAEISGITLTNSNARGYALWVESSRNVKIAYNTFANTTHDGVFLTGDANATITSNLFTKNRASGISALGTSSGEIKGNEFNDTGFGLSIGQRSQVLVTGNRIVNNVDGIVISNIATPTLRGNLIGNSKRNGVVILKDRNGQPNPDLGTAASPGQNIIKGNKEKDLHNATGVTYVVVGNEIDKKKVAGSVDLVPASSPLAPPQIVPSTATKPIAPPDAKPAATKPTKPSTTKPTAATKPAKSTQAKPTAATKPKPSQAKPAATKPNKSSQAKPTAVTKSTTTQSLKPSNPTQPSNSIQ
jgi:parallel beta-helix repeat protein